VILAWILKERQPPISQKSPKFTHVVLRMQIASSSQRTNKCNISNLFMKITAIALLKINMNWTKKCRKLMRSMVQIKKLILLRSLKIMNLNQPSKRHNMIIRLSWTWLIQGSCSIKMKLRILMLSILIWKINRLDMKDTNTQIPTIKWSRNNFKLMTSSPSEKTQTTWKTWWSSST